MDRTQPPVNPVDGNQPAVSAADADSSHPPIVQDRVSALRRLSRQGNPVDNRPQAPQPVLTPVRQDVDDILRRHGLVPNLASDPLDAYQFGSSPFTEAIQSESLPAGVRIPLFDQYDGTSDPLEHLNYYCTQMSLLPVSDAIVCKAFSASLKKSARTWYYNLPRNSISSFRELSRQFATHFIASKQPERDASTLSLIKQGSHETLRAYVARFAAALVEIPNANQSIALQAAIAGVLRNSQFFFSVTKSRPQTMEEIRMRAAKYIGQEDAMLALDPQQPAVVVDKKQLNPDPSVFTRLGLPGGSGADRPRQHTSDDTQCKRKLPSRFEEYTPLNTPPANIFMEVRHRNLLREPASMKAPASKRSTSKYCEFHKDHGHTVDNCYDLRDAIEELIRKGQLKQYVERAERRHEENKRREMDTMGSQPDAAGTSTRAEPEVYGEVN